MPSNSPADADDADHSTPPDSQCATRRRVLAAGAGLAAALAGCSGQREQPGTRATDTPEVSPGTPTEIPTEPDPAPALSGPWPTVHADAANTGAVDFDGPRGSPSVRWQGHVDLETDMLVTDGPDGPVAVQENGLVVAYDSDGSRRWQSRHPGKFYAAPVLAEDGTAIVGSRDGTITAYEADGSRRWRRTTMDGVFAPHANDATPFEIAGDTVVLAHPHGEAMAFDLGNGVRRWSVDVPRRCHRPAVDGERLFLVGNGDDRRTSIVLSLALSDGSTHWSVELDQNVRIGLGLTDGTIYHGDIDGLFVARDAADGSERWRVQLPDDPWISTIPRVFGGRIWVGTLSGDLFALTAAGIEFHIECEGSTTPVVGDDRLYVGSSALDGSRERIDTVVALDEDGTELWRTGTRGRPNAQVVYRDGSVIAATESGVVDSFNASDGKREWRAYERADRVPSPVVGDGAVYCGSAWNWVNGFTATDGTSHLWGMSFDGPSPGAPVVAGETVIAGSHSGGVAGIPVHEYADPPTNRLTATPSDSPTETEIHIDAPLPEPRWRVELDGPVGDFGYGDGGAYVGSGSSIVALTAAGDIRWEQDVGEPIREAPAVVDGTVYAATREGTLVALPEAGSEERWRQSVGEAATAPAFTSVDGTPALVVGTESSVVAVDADSGEERWRTETAGVRGSPAIAGDLAVVGDEAGVLRGLALTDGAERWRVETGGAIHGAPAVGGSRTYVGSRDRRLYAVAVEDGSVAWRLELSDWVDGSPALAYGALFVIDQSGTISAIHGRE